MYTIISKIKQLTKCKIVGVILFALQSMQTHAQNIPYEKIDSLVDILNDLHYTMNNVKFLEREGLMKIGKESIFYNYGSGKFDFVELPSLPEEPSLIVHQDIDLGNCTGIKYLRPDTENPEYIMVILTIAQENSGEDIEVFFRTTKNNSTEPSNGRIMFKTFYELIQDIKIQQEKCTPEYKAKLIEDFENIDDGNFIQKYPNSILTEYKKIIIENKRIIAEKKAEEFRLNSLKHIEQFVDSCEASWGIRFGYDVKSNIGLNTGVRYNLLKGKYKNKIDNGHEYTNVWNLNSYPVSLSFVKNKSGKECLCIGGFAFTAPDETPVRSIYENYVTSLMRRFDQSHYSMKNANDQTTNNLSDCASFNIQHPQKSLIIRVMCDEYAWGLEVIDASCLE